MKTLVKEIRTRRGWSQAELSKRSCVPQPVISEIETEGTADPKLSTMFKLATALKCTVDDLIDDETA